MRGAPERQRALARGHAAEERACALLTAQGAHVLARNVRFRVGEIDIVAREGNCWIFVEVRHRARRDAAAASIDAAKRGRIRRAARLFLGARFGDRWPACRFDVILVDPAGVHWVRGAFSDDEEIP